MPALTGADLLRTLDAAARRLMDAAGYDGRLTRPELRRLLASASGPERDLLLLLDRLIRERSAGRITQDVIREGIGYVRSELLPQFELAPGALSESESRAFAALHPQALQLAALLKQLATPVSAMTASELAEALRPLTEGLFFDYLGSEGSQPIEALHLPAQAAALTPESLAQALGLAPADPRQAIARFQPAAPFFPVFIEQHRPFGLAEAAAAVAGLMQTHLRDLSVAVLGEDGHPDVDPAHPAYVLGLAADGGFAGFRTEVIWT